MFSTRVMVVCCLIGVGAAIADTGGQAASGTSQNTGGQAASGTSQNSGGQAASGTEPAFFPILPWDKVHGRSATNGIDSIAACGFTMAGFVQPEDLPECERLGLKAILAPPQGGSPFSRDGWQKLNDGDIDAYVKQMVESARNSPAVIGYFIVDEPGVLAFPSLAKAVAAVRRHAPGKLAYINLFPGYATIGAPDRSQLGTASYAEYLETFVREVKPQFISYDNYMVQYSDDLEDAKVAASYFRDLLEVRRVALASNLPFWNIASSNQIRPVTTPPSPANLLMQAYTTLAAGGRGLSWYTYYGGGYGYGAVDKQGQRTETWGYLRMVNEQIRTLGPIMNRLQSTGVFFTASPPVETAAVLPGRLVSDVSARTSLRAAGGAKPPLMIGEFAGTDGHDYVMLVNLNLGCSVNVKPILHQANHKMTIISAADGRDVPLDPEQGHWLVAGQGVLIRVDG